jgi:hypothetical protein
LDTVLTNILNACSLIQTSRKEGDKEIFSTQYVILVPLLIQTVLFDTLQPRTLYNKNIHRKNIETAHGLCSSGLFCLSNNDDLPANHFICFGNKIEIQYTIN